MITPCLLDEEIFTCRVCRNTFDHTQGTWIPIGVEKKKPIRVIAGTLENPPIILGLDLRKPEIVTSDQFTCYDCAN